MRAKPETVVHEQHHLHFSSIWPCFKGRRSPGLGAVAFRVLEACLGLAMLSKLCSRGPRSSTTDFLHPDSDVSCSALSEPSRGFPIP